MNTPEIPKNVPKPRPILEEDLEDDFEDWRDEDDSFRWINTQEFE